MNAKPIAANKEAFGIAGQVAVVTGASSGLGRACAILLGCGGAKVVVNHLPTSAEAAAKVCEEIESFGGEAFAYAADVSDEDQVAAMFAESVARFGTLHILVNNAGIQNGARFQDMTLAQWQKVIDVNLTGMFLCSREAIREFLRRGPQPEVSRATGKIICMSSVHQVIPWAFEINYAASKGGVNLLMQSLAQEFAPHKIRVNAVAPGAIPTRINRSARETEEETENLLSLIPYGRIGEPADVAHAVLWLASDLSDYMNGTTMFVDGGMSTFPAFRGGG
ncbi:glucose 1-dehydrogenase [Nitrosovibrio sp. Nv6]|uniref:glucose 1-dehydrogenase n=1 Tax=Nitrosovibrio sp. Nv6 TaxID=1855340 RepID=UPI0008AB1883|nr:glucose 1-dehydrogenase [Nitrosovibrio sp. Nv6]SEP27918.1 glucose 1-dehydrogenase [Nitrosovibrio sp. Nv6]